MTTEEDLNGTLPAETLQQQLETAERLALVAGLKLAAEWIRDHSEQATVFVEDGNGYPVKMLAWVAKERKLSPITCAVCGHIATEVDSLHPGTRNGIDALRMRHAHSNMRRDRRA